MPRPPLRILWIDDDEAEHKIMQLVAAECADSAAFQWERSGETALAAVGKAGQPAADLIMLDIQMPGLSGFEVLKRIRAHALLKRTPVLMYSTSSRAEDVLKSYDLGANSYAVKPTTFEQACAFIKTVCAYWAESIVLPTRIVY